MNRKLQIALGAAGLAVAATAAGQVTLYSGPDFRGQTFTADRPVWNLERFGFNDRASSAVVDNGNWQVCEDARFNGRCVVLQPGQYGSLRDMGLDNQISSVRPVDSNVSSGYDNAPRYAQGDNAPRYAQGGDEYQRRDGERLFDARVTDVRAVVGPPEQRCWVERQDVVQDNGNANVPGAVIGGIIGGILGHQVGEGRGNTAATIGGAVAGAAIGGNVNRGGGQGVVSQDVQRCAYAPSDSRPAYYDVTYNFRGQEHHVQLTNPPGPTITVNRDGEPRT